MTRVKKTGVIESIFTSGVYPAYAHVITGERFPYNEDWNMHANYSNNKRLANMERLYAGEELTKEEKKMMLAPGLVNIKNDHWFEEWFEVIE